MSDEKIISLVSSLLPIIITILFAWLSSRNEDAKRRMIIEEAKQRIELIKEFVNAQEIAMDDPAEILSVKKTAAKELYEIKAFLDKRLLGFEKVANKSDNFLQRFFLIYKMRTFLASLFRAGFFFMLFISLIWSITIPNFAFSSATGENSTLVGVMASLMLILPVLFVVLVLRWLAVKFDKPIKS